MNFKTPNESLLGEGWEDQNGSHGSTKIVQGLEEQWLGGSIGFQIQTVAIVLSALSAIALLYINSRQAKKRATVDLVLHETTNPEIIEAKKQVRHCHDNKVDITQLSCKGNENKPENASIKIVLNNYEFIAAGIKEGAFDEEIYKRMKRSILVRDWEAFSAYITELRRQTKRNELYMEFGWLAARWSKNKIKPNVTWIQRVINYVEL